MKFTFDEFLSLQSGDSMKKEIANLDEDRRENFEERAAILEFCAGLQREEAERRALAHVSQAP